MRKRYGIGQYSGDAADAWASVEERTLKPNGTITGAVLAHGHSNLTHAAIALLYDQLFLGDIAHAVARSGRPVFGGDFQDNAWGNNGAILSAERGFTWLKSYVGAKPTELYLIGGSMGFLTCMNFAHWLNGAFEIDWFGSPWARPSPLPEIKAIAGIIPATHLDAIHDENRSGYAAEIEAAHGGLATYNAALPTHDPSQYASAFATLNIPIKLWASTNDASVLWKEVNSFAEDVNADVVSLGAIGHSYYGMDLDEIAEFFDVYS